MVKAIQFHLSKPYLDMPLNFPLKKFYVKCRLGILPIRLHTGRFERPRIPEADRLCVHCKSKKFDNILHFCLICPFNSEERDIMLSQIPYSNFIHLTDTEKLQILLNDPILVKIVAMFIYKSLEKRSLARNKKHLQ